MGHSTNLAGLRVGISFKWRLFFTSTLLVNYYYDFTVKLIKIYSYLYFLLNLKYKKLLFNKAFLYSHIVLNKINENFFVKVYILDMFKHNLVQEYFRLYKVINYRIKQKLDIYE